MSNIFRKGWISIHISMGLSSMENYINEMEASLLKQIQELKDRFHEETKHLSNEDAQLIYEYNYEDELYNFQTEFKDIFRKSIVISMYSFLEIELNKICMHLEANNNYNKKVADLTQHTGIFKSHYFLKNIVKLDFPTSLNEEWKKIKKINKVRNHFIHNDNNILDEYLMPKNNFQKKSNDLLLAFQYFELAKEDERYNSINNNIYKINKHDVIIHEQFPKEVLNIINNFFDDLLNTLKLY